MKRDQLTQHLQHIQQQRLRIIVLDNHLEQPQLHDVVRANQMLGDLGQCVEMSHRHVRRQPLLVRAVRDVDVEAVELCRWRESAGKIEEPDSEGKVVELD